MTATPIPRTLALARYGDLDTTAAARTAAPAARRCARRWPSASRSGRPPTSELREELRAGRQAYVVCPLIEEGRSRQQGAAAPPAGEELRAARSELVGCARASSPTSALVLLHGGMRPREKQEAMGAFASGAADVLVATTVIEVGIDVPNATVMLIENAERFGISQLHQLRGRVGPRRAPPRCAACWVRPRPPLGRACGRWPSTPTASAWPRSTCACAARASWWAPASRGSGSFRFARPARGRAAARAGPAPRRARSTASDPELRPRARAAGSLAGGRRRARSEPLAA